MFLLFFEAAFSICLGCKIFNLVMKEKATHCPGGVCEIQIKDDVQKFNPIQRFILIATVVAMLYGTYSYFVDLKDRTIFVKKMKELFLSDETLEQMQYEKDAAEFENEDFWVSTPKKGV